MNQPLPHRNVPSSDDIAAHELRRMIQEDRCNSITANAFTFLDFLEYTSSWNQRHIVALRMLDFNDLPVFNMYPQEYYPQIDDDVIFNMQRMFKLSKDNVRKGNFDATQTGPAFSFYRSLQECLRTQQKTPSPPQPSARPQRSLPPLASIHQHTISDSSGSSFQPSVLPSLDVATIPLSEDKTELATSILLMNYLNLLADSENRLHRHSTSRRVLFRLLNNF